MGRNFDCKLGNWPEYIKEKAYKFGHGKHLGPNLEFTCDNFEQSLKGPPVANSQTQNYHHGDNDKIEKWLTTPLFEMPGAAQLNLAKSIYDEEVPNSEVLDYRADLMDQCKQGSPDSKLRFVLWRQLEISNNGVGRAAYILSDLQFNQHMFVEVFDYEFTGTKEISTAQETCIWQHLLDLILFGLGELIWDEALSDRIKAVEKLHTMDSHILLECEWDLFTRSRLIIQSIKTLIEMIYDGLDKDYIDADRPNADIWMNSIKSISSDEVCYIEDNNDPDCPICE